MFEGCSHVSLLLPVTQPRSSSLGVIMPSQMSGHPPACPHHPHPSVELAVLHSPPLQTPCASFQQVLTPFTRIYGPTVAQQGRSSYHCWRDGGDRAGDAGMGGASSWEPKNAASPHSFSSCRVGCLYTESRAGSSTSAPSAWTGVSLVLKQGTALTWFWRGKAGLGTCSIDQDAEPLPREGFVSLFLSPMFFFLFFFFFWFLIRMGYRTDRQRVSPGGTQLLASLSQQHLQGCRPSWLQVPPCRKKQEKTGREWKRVASRLETQLLFIDCS